MSSDKKWLANRNNAKKSTGPKTTSGKALASRNAARHGLASFAFPENLFVRAAKIATALCKGDRSDRRYDAATAIGEAQATIEHIRNYRATKLAAAAAHATLDPNVWGELVNIERYERGAWSRRQKAIMVFETLGVLARLQPPPT